MKNAIAIVLIFTCFGANWQSSGESRFDTPRLHGSCDRSGSLPQDVCRNQLPVESAKLVCCKAAWDLLFPIALGNAPAGDSLRLSDVPQQAPLVSTLQSQHILLRL